MWDLTLTHSQPLSNTADFWVRILAAIHESNIGLFSDSGLIYVAMSDAIKMEPFVRNKEELFTETVTSAVASNKFRVVINGQFYSLTQMGKSTGFKTYLKMVLLVKLLGSQ